MYIDSKDIAAYLERQAHKFNKDFAQLPAGEKFAGMYGIAVSVIWELMMDLDPDIRVKHIKKMKGKA